MRTVSGRTLLIGAVSLLIAGCGGPKQITVDHRWVRLSAVPANPAAAYFTLHGGPKDATLIAVTTDVAVKAEMHETMKTGQTMTTMEPVASVPLPARSTVAFKPGGRHVMFFSMNPGIKPGATIALTFTFANGQRIVSQADVVGAGDPAPE